MDKSYMESVWWVFKEMYQKGLIYRDFKVMPYSTALTTQLSNFEKGLNYQNRRDPAIIVKFVVIPNNRLWLLIITHWFRVFNLLEKAPNEIFDLILVFSAEKNTFFLAWTYQPWTLLGNLALCVNKNLTYVKFQDETGNYYYCGKNALNKRKKQNAIIKGRKNFKFTVIEEYNGSQLVGMKYEPLFSYFSSRKHCFCVVDDDFVSETEGTGIFPLAPAHGEDDFRVCQNVGIYKKGRDKIPCLIDHNGKFRDNFKEYAGQYVFDANINIIKDLRNNNLLWNDVSYDHSTPHCWRSNTPLLSTVVDSWFVNVTAIKDKLVENNKKTIWVPSYVQQKRFYTWLANAHDWCISRNRYW
eukprot:36327_1